MSYAVVSAAATLPLTVAEVLAHCRIDASNQEPAPGVLTCALVSPAVAGNVDNGAHRYCATFVTADGETQAGDVSAVVTVADKTVNGKVTLTVIPLGGSLVTARKLYRTAAGGSTYLLLATIADNTTTTYTDNVADASLGAQAPSVNTTSDPWFRQAIEVATLAAQQELGRYLVTQTVELYLDEFPDADDGDEDYAIVLPPLQSCTSISYVDTDGNTQTLAADQYRVDAKSRPARITPAYGCFWPSTRDVSNAVTVRFVAGYGAASAVPVCIKQWMLMKISALRDNPSALVPGSPGIVRLPADFYEGLLDPERVLGRTS